MTNMHVQPFNIDVDPAVIDDLRNRIRNTRWPQKAKADWSRGTSSTSLRRLLNYWSEEFDWDQWQNRLNAREQVLVDTGLGRIHAMIAGDPSAPPVLLLHGWPDTFAKFEPLLDTLSPHLHLIAASLPGHGFSDVPDEECGPAAMAERLHRTMTRLGHAQYGIRADDIGVPVAENLAALYPHAVTRLQVTSVPAGAARNLDPATLSDDETEWLSNVARWRQDEGAYAVIQGTKPQTIGFALEDSPSGLASWQLEKFHAWSGGDDEFASIGAEMMALNLTIYWVTRTATSAAQFYYDAPRSKGAGPIAMPIGVHVFPFDVNPTPRSIAERLRTIDRWTVAERGGHFSALEQPVAVAQEILSYFAD